MKKKELEILLSRLEEIKKPKVLLEQYTIPSNLAAEILYFAYLNGDIKDKIVFDFGCGTGRLAIGASLLGAKLVVGIDIDKSVIRQAKENLKLVKAKNVFFVLADITNLHCKGDTVIQNPPFGCKRRHADRIFLRKALEAGKVVYSLHRDGYKKTREFIKNFVKKYGGRVTNIIKMKFRLPAIFRFHKKPKVVYKVDLYRIVTISYSAFY